MHNLQSYSSSYRVDETTQHKLANKLLLQLYQQYITFTGHTCSFIHFPVVPNLEHRAPFGVSVIVLWTSDQPVTEASTYTGQHNIQTQETNIHAPSGIRTRGTSNQAAADLHLRPRGH
jgi:hypothetical protein